MTCNGTLHWCESGQQNLSNSIPSRDKVPCLLEALTWLDGTRACFHGDPVWRITQPTITEGHNRILQMGCMYRCTSGRRANPREARTSDWPIREERSTVFCTSVILFQGPKWSIKIFKSNKKSVLTITFVQVYFKSNIFVLRLHCVQFFFTNVSQFFVWNEEFDWEYVLANLFCWKLFWEKMYELL